MSVVAESVVKFGDNRAMARLNIKSESGSRALVPLAVLCNVVTSGIVLGVFNVVHVEV